MSDNPQKPTSGYIADISSEQEFPKGMQDNVFSNIVECYVSKSGATRMFSAVRYGRRYLLKCLKPDFMYTPIYRQAIVKEFEIGLQLDHPNICRTISMETVDGLGECIVMEYIDGETLETAVENGNIDKSLVCKIAGELLDAMEYMHSKHIVHRDIKPSNIMISYNGRETKLIDFGLSDSESFCILKSPAGTRGYIAPEQLLPGAKNDPRSDIYSFGKVLEYMAEATNCRRMLKIGQRCAADNLMQRPGNICEVKTMMTGNRRRLLIVNILLSAVSLFLLVVIVFALNTRMAKRVGCSSSVDTTMVGGDNKVVDSKFWH